MIICLWGVWRSRNKLVFFGKNVPTGFVVSESLDFLEIYTRQNAMVNGHQPVSHEHPC